MSRKEYFGKGVLGGSKRQLLKEHCAQVSALASAYAEHLQAKEVGALVGILHDAGKYGELFQQVLEKRESGIDHATPGAVLLGKNVRTTKTRACIEAIAGHHGGLRPYAALSGPMGQMVRNSTDTVNCGSKRCSVPNQYGETIATIQERLLSDFPQFASEYFAPAAKSHFMDDVKYEDTVEYMMMTRMLYSCLIDADYSASARFTDESYLTRCSGGRLDVDSAEKALDAFMNGIRKESGASDTVNAVRNELFQNCCEAGDNDAWLHTVTAPTGAGKTLALLKLALRKCRTLGLDRIIVVLPFLSIADQTEQIYSRIVPNLLVDHSLCKLNEDQQEIAERWDAPCVITTSVNFFESLFAANGPTCRKLHNLSNSIVIFDEAQTLPYPLLRTTIETLNTLSSKCRMALVLSTATQPAFDILNEKWRPVEVVKDVKSLYHRMKRVNIDWKLSKAMPLSQIAKMAQKDGQALVVTNLKAHAKEVYRAWCGREGTYLVTTDLCPEHRRKVLDEIKWRLQNGLQCLVSATQCIEAGVDVDFPFGYRALAPLPSITQAAGRICRNGNGQGKLVVFIPSNGDDTGESKRLYPDNWYQYAAITTKYILMENGGAIDIDDPDVIREYYEKLYRSAESKDKEALVEAISLCDYKGVESTYKIIASSGSEVIVPYDNGKGTYERVWEAVKQGNGVIHPTALEDTAGITVSTFAEPEKLGLVCKPIFFESKAKDEPYFSGKYIICPDHKRCYDGKYGFQITET